MMQLQWTSVVRLLRHRPAGSVVRVPRPAIEHPRDAGMRLTVGMDAGQRGDYRMGVAIDLALRVWDFGSYYEARLERRVPRASVECALRDAPGASIASTIACGALTGLALGRTREASIAGAAIGALIGLAGVSVATADISPRTSNAAAHLATELLGDARLGRNARRALRARFR